MIIWLNIRACKLLLLSWSAYFHLRGRVCGSPALLSNILGFPNDDERPRLISLRPSPFGQRQPAIPTAKSVTIARIASPFSINRKYQTASLTALKSYFASTKRLIKANDVIALSLYVESDSTVDDSDSEGEDENENDRCADHLTIPHFTLGNIHQNRGCQ
jgi:peroxin-6